jgi:toll-interacting protein
MNGWAFLFLLILFQIYFSRYQLSGPQGEGKEGVINLVVSFSPVPRPQNAIEVEEATAQIPPPAAGNAEPIDQMFTEEELNELAEMFPNIEREVIKQVLEANRGAKDQTVNSLIEMGN